MASIRHRFLLATLATLFAFVAVLLHAQIAAAATEETRGRSDSIPTWLEP